MENPSEHLAGPWAAVLADYRGFVYPEVEDALDAHDDDTWVTIYILRGPALPADRDGGALLRLPFGIEDADVAYELGCYLVDPDGPEVSAAARYLQAQAMAAGLNAAGQRQVETVVVDGARL